MSSNEIAETELSIQGYAAYTGLTASGVHHRIRKQLVVWRYLFPNTEEYIVIEKDSFTPKKCGRKRKDKQ